VEEQTGRLRASLAQTPKTSPYRFVRSLPGLLKPRSGNAYLENVGGYKSIINVTALAK
jgi:hypothetical protein